MTATTRCRVYEARGRSREHTVALDGDAGKLDRRTAPENMPVQAIMSRMLVCARRDLEIDKVLAVLLDHHVGCVPVVDEACRPVGMITERDVVEQVEAVLRDRPASGALPWDLRIDRADEVMMPIALTLHAHATVAHAAAMMTTEGIHHVLLVDDAGVLVGVVSAKDIVTWLARGAGTFRSRPPRLRSART